MIHIWKKNWGTLKQHRRKLKMKVINFLWFSIAMHKKHLTEQHCRSSLIHGVNMEFSTTEQLVPYFQWKGSLTTGADLYEEFKKEFQSLDIPIHKLAGLVMEHQVYGWEEQWHVFSHHNVREEYNKSCDNIPLFDTPRKCVCEISPNYECFYICLITC